MSKNPDTMSNTLIRYILLQLPAAALVAILLFLLYSMGWVSLLTAGSLFLLWALKDAVLYPLTRSAYEKESRTGLDALCGMHGHATQDIQDTGYIRLRGELWKAKVISSSQAISRGDTVVVVDCRDRTLLVSRTEN